MEPSDHLRALWTFIAKFRWYVDIKQRDFFTQNHWNNSFFPLEWREYAETLSLEDMIPLAQGTIPKICKCPESFKSFISEIQRLNIARQAVVIDTPPLSFNNLNHSHKQNECWGMTDKKSHEIIRASHFIFSICKKLNIQNVVDVGVGKGYLPMALVYDFGLRVIGVDKVNHSQFTEIFAKRIRKNPKDFESKLTFISETIAEEGLQKDSRLSEILKESQDKWLLCSLHSCGNLSITMLRLFMEHPKITAMVNIGCCYNLQSDFAFPLSVTLKNIFPQPCLNRSMKMCSLQVPEKWNIDVTQTLDSFKHHFYRALLDKLLTDHGYHDAVDESLTIGKLPSFAFQSFQKYVDCCRDRIGISVEISDTAIQKCADDNVLDIPKIAFLWTLRSLMGTVIESLILLDRSEYLRDTGIKAKLIPIFNREISARNIAIVALKE